MFTTAERLWWPFVAALVTVLVITSARAEQQTENKVVDLAGGTEWMRGVPQGCRLVSFDLRGGRWNVLGPNSRVEILWSYALSDERHETAVLIKDLAILKAEPSGGPREGRLIPRVTVAITPQQAERLRLAAICGTLQMRDEVGKPLPGEGSLPTWDIGEIEDRTESIEAGLADARNLERPMLAAPSEILYEGIRGAITVPVEIEFQR